MSTLSEFKTDSSEKASDSVHGRKILKAITTYETVVSGTKSKQYKDWMKARNLAKAVKSYAIANLPSLLEEFESNAASRGIKILWAETAKEAMECFFAIAKKHNAKVLIKSKSMTTEELNFNDLAEEQKFKVWESDLGELIVQLAGEKPYHIVTPAMHKSKAEIGELFARTLGCPPTEDAEELTAVARKHLRNAFVTADIGVTGANFLIADTGAIVITENEGNARLTTACPPVHVAFAGIEKIIPRLVDLELFLPLLATSGTGQQITCYNSIIRGPRDKLGDGPEEMYVILIDNGRSHIFQDPEFQEALRCIRCGACLNACPVYRTIGGHSYHTTYQGPIGSVITPHLKDFASWSHLSQASSLCGACTSVCPVGIDLHHLLLKNRERSYKQGQSGLFWVVILKFWAFFIKKRPIIEILRPLAKLIRSHKIPSLSKNSFASQWRKNEQ